MAWIKPDFDADHVESGNSGNIGGERSGRSGFYRAADGRPKDSSVKPTTNSSKVIHDVALRKAVEPTRPRSLKTDHAFGASPPNRPKTHTKDDPQDLWTDKYQPQAKAELAVNNRKIADVETWMRNLQSSNKGRVLLLTGPAGAGKSTTVRVLAKELGINLLEWNPPIVLYNPDGDNSSYESQQALFEQFLTRSSRYKSALNSPETAAKCPTGRISTLVLVEDIPQFYFRDPGTLHSLLRRFIAASHAGLVFVVTENFAGNCQSRTLFGPGPIQSLGITVINFNKVIDASLRKHLLKIISKEYAKSPRAPPSSSNVEEIVTSCNGDIRGAITALQFSANSDESHKRKRKRDEKVTAFNAISERDQSLILFRAVGRVFYVKRNMDEPVNSLGLPKERILESRRPLTYVPEEIFDRCTTNDDTYIAFLHENYPHFIKDISESASTAEWFSIADYMSSDWKSREVTHVHAASVVVRGLMHLNQTGNTPFHAITKPVGTGVMMKVQEMLNVGHSILMESKPCIQAESVFTDIFPYLARILPRGNASAIRRFLDDVSFFPNRVSRERKMLREDEDYDSHSAGIADIQDDSQYYQPGITAADNPKEMHVADPEQRNLDVAMPSSNLVEEVVIEDFDDDW